MPLSRINRILLLSTLALLAALIYLANAWSGLHKYQVVFYYARPATFLLSFLIVPLCLLMALRLMFYPGRKTTSRRLLLSALSVVLVVSANVIACGATVPLIFTPYSQLDVAAMNGRLYRLDTIFSPGIGGDHESVMLLWECEPVGLFCRIIYSDNLYRGMTPALETGADSSALLLTVNGEVVYTASDQ